MSNLHCLQLYHLNPDSIPLGNLKGGARKKSLASSENFSLGSCVFIAEVPQAVSSRHGALLLLLVPAEVFCSL